MVLSSIIFGYTLHLFAGQIAIVEGITSTPAPSCTCVCNNNCFDPSTVDSSEKNNAKMSELKKILDEKQPDPCEGMQAFGGSGMWHLLAEPMSAVLFVINVILFIFLFVGFKEVFTKFWKSFDND